MAKDKSDWDLTSDADRDRIGGGSGASDADVPDADTGMAADEVINRGDIEEDRKRAFPELEDEKTRPDRD